MENHQKHGEPDLRYPETVGLLRHVESDYNALKKKFPQLASFQDFHALFRREYYENGKTGNSKPDLDILVLRKEWPSPELQRIAMALYEDVRKIMKGVSDYDTSITEEGQYQGEQTGSRIVEHLERPDIIYYSPYRRTRQTLEALLSKAPADWSTVTRHMNESIREQEHGMQTVFNDWRLSFVFEPMEMLHYIKQGPYAYRYKGGESKFDVRQRAGRFIGRLRRKHEGEKVLAVSHHLMILGTLAELLHWSREEFMEWDENRRPANCGVTILRRQEKVSRTGKDLLMLRDEDYSKKLYE